MSLKAIEPRRLYRQVADELRSVIESGEYAVGDRLPTERELSEQLGISRPTVREALIALEVEGRIRIRVGSGIYVAKPSQAEACVPAGMEGPFEVLGAREIVESAVAREAASLAGAAEIDALDAVLARMENGPHPSAETIGFDRAFHVAVAGILGNAVLVRFVGELFDQRMTPYFERLSRYFENDASWRLAHTEHRAVRDAIASGNAAAAEAAMRHHLQESQKRFQIGFGEGDAEGAGTEPKRSKPRKQREETA